MKYPSVYFALFTCAIFDHSSCAFLQIKGLNWNIKDQLFMDSTLFSSCGKTKESVNGQIFSHKGAMGDIIDGIIDDSLIPKYEDTTNCTVAVNVSSLGSDYRILLQFETNIDLAGTNTTADCDTLEVYDGDMASVDDSEPLKTFCGTHTKPTALESTGTVMTFRFEAHNNENTGKGFVLAYSAFRNPADGENCTAEEFQCDTDRCIASDLTCDGSSHCIDKTDEDLDAAECSKALAVIGYLLSLGLYTLIGIGAGILGLIMILIILCCCCCNCCKKTRVRRINIKPVV